MLSAGAQDLQAQLGIPADSLLAAAHDSALAASVGDPTPSLEGYLYPSTYLVRYGVTAHEVVKMMVDEFQAQGASMVMLAKGNRSKSVVDACKKHGGVLLGSIGGPAAILGRDNIKAVRQPDFAGLGDFAKLTTASDAQEA